MRTAADRLRHTLMFEVFGLVLSTPLAAMILHRPVYKVGALAVGLSITAMAWNLVYNILFDHLLIRLGRRLDDRPFWLRALHAVCFEGGLLVFTVPAVAIWLNMPLVQAFLADMGFVLFYLVYAYLFNYAYDRVFPIPVPVSKNGR